MGKKNKAKSEGTPQKQVPWICTARVALAMVGFLGFVNLYALRINMSVAMVCMINETALRLDSEASMLNGSVNASPKQQFPESCMRNNGDGNKTSKDLGELNWSKPTQGMVLSAFFWGYLVTQVPGGWLAQKFGGKRVFGWFMLMTAISTLLSPVGARVSPYFLIVLRVINGIGQGVVFPSMHDVWSKWAPPLERSKLIGFTYAGAQIGNVLTLPISGLLCEYGFDGGWASIFYVLGSFGVLWFILWMVIASDSPAQHPRITAAEREFIETSIGATKKHPSGSIPWLAFVKSPAVWAIVVAHTCSNWGTYTLLTNIPAYMKEVLNFDIKSNGLFSAIPYIVFWAAINIGGVIADTLRAKGIRTTIVRKVMLSIGTLVPAVLLIATGFVSCENAYVAVAVLSLAVGFSGFQYPGVMVNHVDIAPPFAGMLFGISNTVATLSGVFAPYAVGLLTTHKTQEEWRTVFYVAAAIYAIGAVFFCVFAQGELQSWAKPYMFDAVDDVAADEDNNKNQGSTKV